MHLRELENTPVSEIEKENKVLIVFLRDCLYTLVGNWDWDLETDSLFCSDVMASPPAGFVGAWSIFHPDDTENVYKAFTTEEHIAFLHFRIITSYGEIRTVTGQNIAVEKDEEGLQNWRNSLSLPHIHHLQLKKESEHLRTLQQVYEKSGQSIACGYWYYNIATGQTWFDDTVFLLHGLPPQSLNPYLHTFRSFLHPNDREAVIEYTDKAFREKIPFHLEYRIVVNGKEKWVRYTSQWFFIESGEEIFSGVLQDITAYKEIERETETWKTLTELQKQQTLYDESQVNIGHWQVDLLTRKTIYSDQYYRIFGIKPQSLPAHINAFVNYIHPSDQEKIDALYKKIINEHAVQDTDYRIQRSDGKLRYVKQTARLITTEGSVMVAGILQDVTVEQMLKKKLGDVTRQKEYAALQQQQADETGRLAGWVTDLATGSIEWSRGTYALLGQKTASAPMTIKTFCSFVHPHDQNEFKAQWQAALQQKQESVFDFRLLQRGALRYMKAIFRIHDAGEAQVFIGTVQDVTVEQSLQEHLTQRMQLTESLTENILDRVMMTDENNTIVLWNKACEKAYGIKREEAIGQNFFDVFPLYKTEAEMALFLKALQGEKVMQKGKRSLTGNGYYDLYLMPLWQSKTVTGILHIVRDVTKEVELQNSLQERLLFIESLVESSVDRIVALDRNLNYQYWNSSAEKYYGLPKEAVLGKNILDVFPRMANDPSYNEFRKALKGETVHLAADRTSEHFFEAYLIPVKNEKNEVTAILWVVHDLGKELLP